MAKPGMAKPGMAKSTAHAKDALPVLRYVAAVLAFASQLIHLWVLPGQLVAAMVPGIFFFLVAVGQGLLGARLLFGAGRWTLRLGLLLNATAVVVWTLTRLVRVPELFEPLRLPVDGLGLVASAIEVALVVLLLRLRRHLPPAKRGRGSRLRQEASPAGEWRKYQAKGRKGR